MKMDQTHFEVTLPKDSICGSDLHLGRSTSKKTASHRGEGPASSPNDGPGDESKAT